MFRLTLADVVDFACTRESRFNSNYKLNEGSKYAAVKSAAGRGYRACCDCLWLLSPEYKPAGCILSSGDS